VAKKIAEIGYDELVVGADVRALLYAFTKDLPCLYIHHNKLNPIVQPTNELLLNNFSEEENIADQTVKEKFLAVDKLGFWLRYLLNLAGKFYETPRDNVRFSEGKITHKTNKTEHVLNANKIHLFDNIKLNGSNQKLDFDGCFVEDYFRTNAKSMEKTWFRGHDPFLKYVCFDGKILKSCFFLKNKAEVNEFENSSVAIRYLLEDFLKNKKEIILIRSYYVNLLPKLQNRVIIPEQNYYTEEDNITVVRETLGELCQKPILPQRESYLYCLTKRILDLTGTTA
jgi:hypothetical protein